MMFKDQIQDDEFVAYGQEDAVRILNKLCHPEGELRSYAECKCTFGRVLVPNTKYPDIGKGVVFEDVSGVMIEYHPFIPFVVTGVPKRLQP